MLLKTEAAENRCGGPELPLSASERAVMSESTRTWVVSVRTQSNVTRRYNKCLWRYSTGTIVIDLGDLVPFDPTVHFDNIRDVEKEKPKICELQRPRRYFSIRATFLCLFRSNEQSLDFFVLIFSRKASQLSLTKPAAPTLREK